MGDAEQSLFIIEAPGKVATIKKILHEIGVSANVVATRGRLLDLPKDKIGLDPDTLEPNEWIPINKHRVQDIIDAAKDADTVYVMTDADREGEVIAHHVIQITGRKDAIRIKATSLTKDAISEAIKNAGKIDKNKVLGGIARRSLDRILGYTLSRPRNYKHEKDKNNSGGSNSLTDSVETTTSGAKKSGFIGRIQTPLLSVAAHSNPIVGWLRHYWQSSDNKPDWALTIPVRRSQIDDAMTLKKEFEKFFPAPAIPLSKHESESEEQKAWDGGECLFWVSHQLDVPVREVSRSMQKSYECGKLSYPRADSRRLSEKSISQINRSARQHRIPFNPDIAARNAADSRENIQDAHEAPIPLMDSIPLHMDTQTLSLDDKVIVSIAKHLMDVGSPNYKIITEIANTMQSKIPENILDLLHRLGVKPVWIRQFKQEQGLVRVQPHDPVFDSSLHEKRKARTSNTVFKQIPNDRILLSMLLSNKLGRPSTYVTHIDKVSARYITKNLELNKDAHLALRLAQDRSPLLMNSKILQQLENVLDVPDLEDGEEPPSVHRRVLDSLRLLGIELDFTKRTIRELERESAIKIDEEYDNGNDFDM